MQEFWVMHANPLLDTNVEINCCSDGASHTTCSVTSCYKFPGHKHQDIPVPWMSSTHSHIHTHRGVVLLVSGKLELSRNSLGSLADFLTGSKKDGIISVPVINLHRLCLLGLRWCWDILPSLKQKKHFGFAALFKDNQMSHVQLLKADNVKTINMTLSEVHSIRQNKWITSALISCPFNTGVYERPQCVCVGSLGPHSE